MTRKVLDSTLETASFNIVFQARNLFNRRQRLLLLGEVLTLFVVRSMTGYSCMFFQIFLRCVTFFLTAFVLRYITSDVVGVMNVRLLLLESTVLFLSREAFRRAALSQTESHSWPQIINLVWLTIPLTVVISLFFGFLWLHILEIPSPDITPHYSVGVWAISISCIIEMLSEPLYIASQAFLFTRLKVALDSLVVLIRTMIFVLWIICNSEQAVVAFSAAQIIANMFYTCGFYVYFYFYIKENNKNKLIYLEQSQKKSSGSVLLDEKVEDESRGTKRVEKNAAPKLKTRQNSLVGFDEPFPFVSLCDFFPKGVENKNWIHPNSAQLTWSFFKQGILKQILTEGERYIMTLFSMMSFKEQGMYDVANNLGSLPVRFLFRPAEDSLYFYFTQSIKRDVQIRDQNQDRMKEAAAVLSQALNFAVGVGLVIFIFGQSYSALLLYLYGGQTAVSGEGPTLLRTISFSVLLLGVNGITECYAFSTMTALQLNKYNYIMAIFSVSFLIISWGLTRLFGSVGFIIANCCIMSARIVHSMNFIKSRYSETPFKPLVGLLPNVYFLTALIISLFITKFTEIYCHKLAHFLVGGVCFLAVVAVWVFQERELMILAIKKWKNLKNKEE